MMSAKEWCLYAGYIIIAGVVGYFVGWLDQ